MLKHIIFSLLLVTTFVTESIVSKKYLTKGCEVDNIKKVDTTAAARGFKLGSDLVYISDTALDKKDIYNGSRYYGTMEMWFAGYKYYVSSNDTMYYYLISSVAMQPNQKTYWDIKGWFNKSMQIDYHIDCDRARVVNFAPSYTIGTTTLTSSYSLNIDSSGNASSSVSWSDQVSYSNITVKNLKDTKSKYDNISIINNFIRYNKNDKNDCSYSYVTIKSAALFEIQGFSSINYSLVACVDYTGSIYRNGNINSSTTSGTYNASMRLK